LPSDTSRGSQSRSRDTGVRQRGDEELDRPTSIRDIVETLERTRSSD